MARLNDPPAPLESIDALKRRFIRQNREIARVNSTQSLRIRNLETEISRLLAENITLREQAIASAQEAEKLRTTNRLSKDVLDMRDKLEMKLKEVNSLVQELGHLPDKAMRSVRTRKQSTSLEQSSSPNNGDAKNRQTLNGMAIGEREVQEGRLPAILEDKYYPRRTLETTEIRSMLDIASDAVSESPEIGPPPVAHFDVSEQIPTGQEKGSSNEDIPVFSNLETRRKRRTSSLLQDMAPSEVQSEQGLQKSGAKRKLDVSDLEVAAPTSTNTDEFVFQRRNVVVTDTMGKKSSRFTRPPGQHDSASESSVQKQGSTTRKILAPKSTNSPTKRRVHISDKLVNKDDRIEEVKSLKKPPSHRKDVAETHRDEAKQDNIQIPPKTPAFFDEIMSPLSTEPSAKDSSRSQEVAVLNSLEDVLNGSIGRGSRRTKALVSYAEPNLRDKMRRPGKELVGAVEGIDRSRGNEKDKPRNPEHSFRTSTGSVIKCEAAIDDAKWNTLPNGEGPEEPTSPLGEKEMARKKTQQTSMPELDEAIEKLSIFDPPMSSPEQIDEAKQPNVVSRRKQLTSRRHSIQPSGSDPMPLKKPLSSRPGSAASNRAEEKEAPARNDLKRTSSIHTLKSEPSSTKLDRAVTRRKSMMV